MCFLLLLYGEELGAFKIGGAPQVLCNTKNLKKQGKPWGGVPRGFPRAVFAPSARRALQALCEDLVDLVVGELPGTVGQKIYAVRHLPQQRPGDLHLGAELR